MRNFEKKFVVNNYSLCPFLIVAVDVRATSLTQFVEKTYNICISKWIC